MQGLTKFCIANRLEYRKAKYIFCTTEETRHLVPSKWRDKTIVMQTIGISMSKEMYLERKSNIENKNNSKIKIIMAGRPLYWKGYNIATAAVEKVLNDGYEVSLEIFGVDKENDSVNNSIHYVDRIPYEDMQKKYDDADIFLNCSLHDSGCMVVLEAMAHGLPVVCIKTGGPSVLVNEQTGIAVEPTEYNKLVCKIAEAIESLIDSPKERIRKGMSGLDRAFYEFEYKRKYELFIEAANLENDI